MATHSSMLALEIPWTEEPGGLQSVGSQRVGHDRASEQREQSGAAWVRSLGREDPLEEGVATHSSILALEIPWTEEPGGLRSIGSHRVRHY